ncbi:MAG: cysteine synthase A [Treponema sp.]|nr:cysteine synthase A [Treponema sp.]MDD7768885.1 cysteine synthase A [Treponema sp.]
MAKIYTSADQLVGHTPLLEVSNIEKELGLNAKVLVKLEYFNPAGSVKDRIAKAMLDDAEKSGKLKKGSTIIEPTSGNTGIGLCSVAAARGYKVIIVMPETMSVERRQIMKAYGAELVLTEGAKGMKGAIAKADELAASIPDSFIPGQFVNPANPKAHYESTGPEIWEDTDGKVDIFVAGVGTGGTITGTGKYLKSKNPDVKVVAVEPASSPVLSKGTAGAHKIQGIGAGFVPDVLDTKVYDEIIPVENDDAFAIGKLVGKKEGVLVGISSGAALWAAIELAKKPENKGKTIVALLPDTGDRYLSTPLFAD